MKKYKKTGKTLLCLALALSMLAGLLVIGATKDWTDAALGELSQYYETGANPDPGKIAFLDGDSGGKSYGIYMFASNPGTPKLFFNWLKSQPEDTLYYEMGVALHRAYTYNSAGDKAEGYGSNFDNVWGNIAKDYPSEFMQAQKDYWMAKHYQPLVDWMEGYYPGFDIDNYGIALKNVLWSRSVHHGYEGAQGLIKNALPKDSFANQSEREIIKAIYDRCCLLETSAPLMDSAWAEKYGIAGKSMKYFSANSGNVQEGVYNRLRIKEPYDALVMMLQNSTATFADGLYIFKSTEKTALSNNGSVSAEGVAQKMTLTWYEGSADGNHGKFYTITNSAGQRLTADADGTVKFAAPTTGQSQFWYIAPTTGEVSGFTLQSVSDSKFVAVEEGGVLKRYSTEELATAGKTAISWQPLAQSDIIKSDFVIPGKNNVLVEGNSGFALRGVLNSAKPITKVQVTVTNREGLGVAEFGRNGTVSGTGNKTYFDLWDIDEKCTFSKLKVGDYKLSVKAWVGEDGYDIISTEFSVKKPTQQMPPEEAEKITVTYMVGSTVLKTKEYNVGEVYGELPVATQNNGEFRGWFLDNGSEVTATTMVEASDHTLHAKFGELYTVTFDPANGKAVTTYKLASGAPIAEPEDTPMKAPVTEGDYTYTYTFAGWKDGSGNDYVGGNTFVGSADITYTAQYTEKKIENPKPEDTTPPDGSGTTQPPAPPKPVDGGSIKLKAQTKVSALAADGYKVYDGSKDITDTSKIVGTGMKLVYGNVETTIVVTGDVSGDGKITITDVVKLQSAVVGKTSLTGAYGKAADVNGDGKVTITDVVQAAQYTVGKRTFN